MENTLTIPQACANLDEWDGNAAIIQGVLFANCEEGEYTNRRVCREYSILFSSFGRLSLSYVPGEYVMYLTPGGFNLRGMQKQRFLRWLQAPKNIGFTLLHLLPDKLAKAVASKFFPSPVVKAISRPLADRLIQIFSEPIGVRPEGYKICSVVAITGIVQRSSLPEFAFIVKDVTRLTMQCYSGETDTFYDFVIALPQST